MARERARKRWRPYNFVRSHALSLILLAIVLLQLWAYYAIHRPEWIAEHGDADGYWRHYWSEVMVSIVADTYGALILVLLTKWFREVRSAESN